MTATLANSAFTSLFVGNLDSRVYRELLHRIFSLAGPVTQCHVVYDKTTGHSSGFGFVQFEDHATAEAAMEKFRGRSVYGKLLTIDWARASARDPSSKPDDPSSQFCLFVGNLSPDVTDDQLLTAFSEFGSCTSAKCAKDPVTYKTQGFAFVTFRLRADALAAMEAMNGQLLNNRPLRVDWAKGKTSGSTKPDEDSIMSDVKKETLSLESILTQTSINNVTAYVSGLSVNTSEETIRNAFNAFGTIREIRIPESVKAVASDTMYAFVRYVDHASAARAIFASQSGATVDGKPVHVHWGREPNRRMTQNPPIQRPAVNPPPFYHSGFQSAQPQYAFHYPPQPYAPHQGAPVPHAAFQNQRPMYPTQPYARGPPPGPVHQPHATTQHRYRPY